MRIRTRKLIGTALLLILIPVYAFVAMALALLILPGQPKLVEILFYLIVGTGWAIPGAVLISWMSRPDPDSV
ncbi:DUF2842 domain-containing protein [Segnochrobactraceae bacterium EtOH-i3]